MAILFGPKDGDAKKGAESRLPVSDIDVVRGLSKSDVASPEVAEGVHRPSRGVSVLRPTKSGRPRIEDKEKATEAQKPWLALGMSRRTWYRRQKEKRDE